MHQLRSPLDVVGEFLNQDVTRADGLNYALEGSFLHVVIVSQRDDESLANVQSLVKTIFQRRLNFPERIVVTVIAPTVGTGAPRLHEYSLAVGANGQHIDIASP